MGYVDFTALGISAGSLLFILSVFIKVPKVEVNIWGWLCRKAGDSINHDVMVQLADLNKKLDEHIKDSEISNADASRQRILRFNDEVLHETHHSREHFIEILKDIDEYEDYCATHPEYPNNRAVLAIENIKQVYKQCLQKNSFL